MFHKNLGGPQGSPLPQVPRGSIMWDCGLLNRWFKKDQIQFQCLFSDDPKERGLGKVSGKSRHESKELKEESDSPGQSDVTNMNLLLAGCCFPSTFFHKCCRLNHNAVLFVIMKVQGCPRQRLPLEHQLHTNCPESRLGLRSSVTWLKWLLEDCQVHGPAEVNHVCSSLFLS